MSAGSNALIGWVFVLLSVLAHYMKTECYSDLEGTLHKKAPGIGKGDAKLWYRLGNNRHSWAYLSLCV